MPNVDKFSVANYECSCFQAIVFWWGAAEFSKMKYSVIFATES